MRCWSCGRSNRSNSDWVRDEAAQGRDRHRLVPLSLDGTQPPLGFRQIQMIDLSGWRGRADAPQIEAIERAIAAAIGQPLPPRRAAAEIHAPGRHGAAAARRRRVAGGGALVAWRTGPVRWRLSGAQKHRRPAVQELRRRSRPGLSGGWTDRGDPLGAGAQRAACMVLAGDFVELRSADDGGRREVDRAQAGRRLSARRIGAARRRRRAGGDQPHQRQHRLQRMVADASSVRWAISSRSKTKSRDGLQRNVGADGDRCAGAGRHAQRQGLRSLSARHARSTIWPRTKRRTASAKANYELAIASRSRISRWRMPRCRACLRRSPPTRPSASEIKPLYAARDRRGAARDRARADLGRRPSRARLCAVRGQARRSRRAAILRQGLPLWPRRCRHRASLCAVHGARRAGSRGRALGDRAGAGARSAEPAQLPRGRGRSLTRRAATPMRAAVRRALQLNPSMSNAQHARVRPIQLGRWADAKAALAYRGAERDVPTDRASRPRATRRETSRARRTKPIAQLVSRGRRRGSVPAGRSDGAMGPHRRGAATGWSGRGRSAISG